MTEQERPVCCGRTMAKAGKGFSGLKKLQRYKCSQCGRVKMPTK